MDNLYFPPTRAAALERLDAFIPQAGRAYAAARNTDSGDAKTQGVSLLSPYIRHRLISEEEIIRRVLRQHSPRTAEKFIQEVAWRTYWKGWLEMRPEIWDAYAESLPSLRAQHGTTPSYLRAIEGRTGIECFDDWAAQLVQTGFLHNHTRMWFASIWIFTLRLPWQLGAAFFYRHLLDGDAASNTLSWRWVAGLHTVGKHYLARAENIRKFTNGRYHPLGQLEEQATALPLDLDIPKPSPPPRYPAPSELGADFAKATVVLTADDTSLDQVLPQAPARVILWNPAKAYAPHQISEHVMTFKNATLRDAADRFGLLGVTGADLEICLEDRLPENEGPLWMARPAVGPLRSLVDRQTIQLNQFRREWDRDLYPLATKGFFPFKKALPDLCRRLMTSEPLE